MIGQVINKLSPYYHPLLTVYHHPCYLSLPPHLLDALHYNMRQEWFAILQSVNNLTKLTSSCQPTTQPTHKTHCFTRIYGEWAEYTPADTNDTIGFVVHHRIYESVHRCRCSAQNPTPQLKLYNFKTDNLLS